MQHYCHLFLQWHPWKTWFSGGSLCHHTGFFWTCRTFERFRTIFLSLTIRTTLNLCVIRVGIGLLRGLNPPGSVLMHSCKTVGLMNIVGKRLAKRAQGGSSMSSAEEQEKRSGMCRTDYFTMPSSDYAHSCTHGKLHGNGNIIAFFH